MNEEIKEYRINKMPPDISFTVRIILTRVFKLRIKIGAFLIILAGLIMGCNIEIIYDDEEQINKE